MASVQEWLDKHERDLRAARDNTQPQKKLKECHLAVESLLKAIIVKRGGVPDEIHNTIQLAQDVPRFPKEKRQLLSYLYSVYDRRYPDDLDYARNTSPKDAIRATEELKNWADQQYFK
ncbi:HEPN domain-containing protein [Halorussus salinus]|uniref:HEPN domain-containing protein n=1 Tax=Halorussus salinus TaxID=1364935 RepID=UPI001092BF4A